MVSLNKQQKEELKLLKARKKDYKEAKELAKLQQEVYGKVSPDLRGMLTEVNKAEKKGSFTALTGVITGLSGLAFDMLGLDTILRPLKLLVNTLKADTVEERVNAMQALMDAIKSDGVQNGLAAAGDLFNLFIQESFTKNIEQTSATIERLNTAFSALGKKEDGFNIIQFLTDINDKMREFNITPLSKILEFWEGIASLIDLIARIEIPDFSRIKTWWEEIRDFFKHIGDFVENFRPPNINPLQNWWENFFDFTKKVEEEGKNISFSVGPTEGGESPIYLDYELE